jgi:hypothetical protein
VGLQLFSSRTLAQNHDDSFNTAASQMFDAGFDYGFVAKGKQRLEGTHALRLACGKNDGCDFVGLWSWVFGLCH